MKDFKQIFKLPYKEAVGSWIKDKDGEYFMQFLITDKQQRANLLAFINREKEGLYTINVLE